MVFSSFFFIFLFLPLVLVTYLLSPSRARNWVGLCASYLFYAWGAPHMVAVLLLASLIDYFLSHRMVQFDPETRGRRYVCLLGVGLNVLLLGYYKYFNFILDEINRGLGWLQFAPIEYTAVLLPIGISFFTFQKISYLVDVYRGITPPARRFRDYALFVALFPQLIAGPIIRYHRIADQIKARTLSLDSFSYGVYRFCFGLGKKVLIADQLGAVADNVFALGPNALTTPYAWVGILSYSFQIYFDFSGYSDMAIGLGRMLGFRFDENFNQPYISRNFTEFWRRWHISLSHWMKEYLYISLGGNRVSRLRLYFNLWVVFLLSGLWHGASWTFVVWGCFHGCFLVADKIGWAKVSSNLPAAVNIALTFFLVTMGWVFFRAESLSQAWLFFGQLSGLVPSPVDPPVTWAQIIHNRGLVMLVLAAILSFAPAFGDIAQRVTIPRPLVPTLTLRRAFAAVVLLLLAVSSLAAQDHSPFLYFKF